jgi:hypothetical protein
MVPQASLEMKVRLDSPLSNLQRDFVSLPALVASSEQSRAS